MGSGTRDREDFLLFLSVYDCLSSSIQLVQPQRNATQKTQTLSLSLSTYIFLRRYLSVNNNTFHEPSLPLQFFFLHHHHHQSYLCFFPFITSLISHELVPSHNSSHSFSSTVDFYFISISHLIFINYYFG